VGGGPTTPEGREAVIQRIRSLPGVTQAIPVIESQALAQGPVAVAGAVVRGVTPADLRATPIVANNIKSGSLRGFGVGEDGGDQVLVGQKLAQTLGIGVGDPISLISPTGGETVFGGLPPAKSYTVGGIFSVGMSEYDQSFIYMPLNQAQLFFGRGAGVDFIEVRLKDPDKAPAMKETLAAATGPGAVVTDWTERNSAYFGALKVEHNVMRMIFMFIVALAALNIISGLVMLVKNKGRDIAILRTMGAGRGAILRIFFMAGASIGIAGTAAGLLFGLVFCLNIEAIQRFVEWVTGVQVFNSDVYFLAHVPAKIDWLEVTGVSLWALAASFFFTLLPAWRASRLDPVDALRYE
jgi:lipoprotein-releasing system permease protein